MRFPSGKILHIASDGLYMPKSGREYLMFLEYDEKSQTYEIITGYQIKEGKVEALDGISIEGGLAEKYRNYPKYNGEEISKFESLVLESLNQNKKCDTTKYTF